MTIVDKPALAVEDPRSHPRQHEEKYISIARMEDILDNLDIGGADCLPLPVHYIAI
jgi:hypothetical protein